MRMTVMSLIYKLTFQQELSDLTPIGFAEYEDAEEKKRTTKKQSSSSTTTIATTTMDPNEVELPQDTESNILAAEEIDEEERRPMSRVPEDRVSNSRPLLISYQSTFREITKFPAASSPHPGCCSSSLWPLRVPDSGAAFNSLTSFSTQFSTTRVLSSLFVCWSPPFRPTEEFQSMSGSTPVSHPIVTSYKGSLWQIRPVPYHVLSFPHHLCIEFDLFWF